MKTNLSVTPYEVSLAKKLAQAVDLNGNLSKWDAFTNNDIALEKQTLQTIIGQVDTATQQFNMQLHRYRDLYEKRRQLTVDSDGCLKQINELLWEDISSQFKEGTLSYDLTKVFYQKIHRLTLPDFPQKRRIQVLYKDVRHHEDAYDLYGKYFTWLLDLLQTIKFIPILFPRSLNEVREQICQFNSLTKQIMVEAESVRNCQLAKQQLFKQLTQVANSVKRRLLIYKREARWITAD